LLTGLKKLKPIVTPHTELVPYTILQMDEGYVNKKLILAQMQKPIIASQISCLRKRNSSLMMNLQAQNVILD